MLIILLIFAYLSLIIHQNIFIIVNIDNFFRSFWVCIICLVIKCPKTLYYEESPKYAYFLLIVANLSLEIQSKLLIIHQNIFVMANIDIFLKVSGFAPFAQSLSDQKPLKI